MIAWQNVFMTRAPLYNSAGIRLGAWEARQVVGKAMVMCGFVVEPTVQRTKWGFLGMIRTQKTSKISICLIEIWIKRKNLFATGGFDVAHKKELHWSRPKGEAKDEDASKTLVTNLDFLPFLWMAESVQIYHTLSLCPRIGMNSGVFISWFILLSKNSLQLEVFRDPNWRCCELRRSCLPWRHWQPKLKVWQKSCWCPWPIRTSFTRRVMGV